MIFTIFAHKKGDRNIEKLVTEVVIYKPTVMDKCIHTIIGGKHKSTTITTQIQSYEL